MWAKLHLVGTLWPLILPNWFGDAFSIFLLRQFFLTIPEEYLDAARVDGCGELRILTTVVVPAGEARDRRRRALLVPLLLQRLLPAAALLGREPATTGCSRSASSQFRSLHQVQWNLTMAATLLVMAPVIVALLPRAAGVRRGRDADGGEGMKLAVDRRRLDLHARARLGPLPRARRLDVRELVLHDIDAERLEVVGGLAARMLDAPGLRRRGSTSPDDLDRALDGADFVLVQIRVGGQEARLADETVPLACGCIGQETTGAGGFAKAMRTVPVVLEIARARARARGGRRVDRRLHEPGRDRHARAARRRPPRRRPLQRRDRLPALVRAAARRRARARGRRPGRPQPPDLGARGAPRRRGRAAAAARRARRRARRAGRRAAAPAARGARRRPLLLPPLLLRARRGARRAARRAAARRRRRRDRARAARALPRPGAGREAGAARAARRRVLQRGGDGLVALARDRRRRRARGRRAERRHARRARRRRRGRGAGARRRATALEPLPQAPLAPELLGLVQHVAAYERLAARGRGDARPRRPRARRCSPIR